jgi:glutamine amidotransferase
MKKSQITVIDYGMGNLWSVVSALKFLGCEVQISGNVKDVVRAESLLLPGVGSFRKAMAQLNAQGLDQAILESVLIKKTKILGICLGMQLMGIRGLEDGDSLGLGLIPTTVEKFSPQEIGGNKIPHIGFDVVYSPNDSQLFQGLSSATNFYFVHSYRMLHHGTPGRASTCVYGTEFMAAYEHENVYATQFHPEKSQTNGLVVLKNFLKL